MEKDELKEYLDALDRSDCYHVEAVLKDSSIERTERVNYVGSNGSQFGPFIRKIISLDSGQGGTYEKLYEAQQNGRRFTYLPRIFECFRTGETLVVILEFIQGRTLQEYVADEGASGMLARQVFPRICDAVIELHEALNSPIIHRDLTPTNILVSGPDVVLIDLGISRTFDSNADRDTTHFGTRAYAPPEQFGFGQTDVRSDVYALGKVLRFCSNGSEGMSASNAERKSPDEAARPTSESKAGGWIDPAVEAVIEVATSLDPADRFQSVAELKSAFMATTLPEKKPPKVPAADLVLPSRTPRSEERIDLVDRPQEDQRSADVGLQGKEETEKSLIAPPVVQPQNTVAVGQGVAARSRSAIGRFFARIPKPLGIVWDAVLVLLWVLFLVLSVMLVFEPNEGLASLPAWFRAVEIFGIAFFPLTIIEYYLLDLRLFRENFPKLRFPSRRKTWFFVPAVVIGLWVLVMIIASICGFTATN